MKICDICGEPFTEVSNVPEPIVPYTMGCCDKCTSSLVAPARQIELREKDNSIDTNRFLKMNDEDILAIIKGREIVLFHSCLCHPYNEGVKNGMFARGTVNQVENKVATGDWGNFAIDLISDSYAILKEQ